MANLPARPKVYELSLMLDKVRESVVADDWMKAAATWRELKRVQARYDADMY